MAPARTGAELDRLLKTWAWKARRRLGLPVPAPAPLPLHGWDEHRHPAGHVELLDDDELAEVNRLLPWGCFTVDSKGRRIGDRTRPGRRDTPQPIPEPWMATMDERFHLGDKHVLEIGCYEGVHTIGLCELADRVTAVDGHVINVAKTAVRCALYGHRPVVFTCNVETWTDLAALEADVLHHVGVLYHLKDPVRHLRQLGRYIRLGVLIDTQVATDATATESIDIDGRTFRYKRQAELPGPERVLTGMFDHAKWLLLDDIVTLLAEAGFGDVDVLDERVNNNGPRVTLLARRPLP